MATIVVVDSEPNVRKLVVTILQRAGHSVHDTGNFTEAVDLLIRIKPDLLLTNVYLQGIAGQQAVRMFKEQFPQLPVLMVSGLPDEKAVEEWGQKEGFDVFPKPFHPQDLVEKVQHMIPRP